MQMRQENLFVPRLGEPTAEGEAGASLLNWQSQKSQSDTYKRAYIFIKHKSDILNNGYLHLLQNAISQCRSQIVLVTL